MKNRIATQLTLTLLAVCLASPALATDGVLEINQTCADSTGCFSGDAPGLPVTIDGSAGRSYRLTSDLTVPDENTDGISISTNDVGIDLNNFAITGPVTCSPAIGSVICAPLAGTGVGIRGVEYTFGTCCEGISVKNGSISGMGYAGIALGFVSEVRNVRARRNAQCGICVWPGSTVSDNVVFLNGLVGIVAGEHSTILRNTSNYNGGTGINSWGGATIAGNTATHNYSHGIHATTSNNMPPPVTTEGATISGNLATYNGGSGIKVEATDSSATVIGNNASSNTVDGISTGHGATVSNNTANANGEDGIESLTGSTVKGNTTRVNTGNGIKTGANSTVIENSASENGERGISTGSGSTLIANTAFNNDAEGIHVGGYGSTVKNNSTRSNGSDGITVAGNGSNIRDSTSRDNGGYGLNISGSTESGYGGNVFSNNSLGHVNGGTQLGENLCGGSICP